MILVPSTVAIFKHDDVILRREVYKSDGNQDASDGVHNRYVYIDGQLRLIATIWDLKFVGFEKSARA